MSLWLIGAGTMAQAYAKVLQAQRIDFQAIGRSAHSAQKFESETGVAVRHGGLTAVLAGSAAPRQAIVAVGIELLAEVANELIRAGTQRILVEKPGGLNITKIRDLQQTASEFQAEVFIAYNRRYYASTELARTMIAEDGGPTSCNFEFTEWSHVIAPLTKAPGIKGSWFLANSTHVADLAFHLCGFPKDWCAWQGGALDWHPSAARFSGSGVTDKDILFSYQADWEAPGRWGVEVLTRRRRFIFRPMEQLQVIQPGSVRVESVDLDDRLDKNFKPGLYKQTKAFLNKDDNWLSSVDEQLQHCLVYNKMAGYDQMNPFPL